MDATTPGDAHLLLLGFPPAAEFFRIVQTLLIESDERSIVSLTLAWRRASRRVQALQQLEPERARAIGIASAAAVDDRDRCSLLDGTGAVARTTALSAPMGTRGARSTDRPAAAYQSRMGVKSSRAPRRRIIRCRTS